MTLIRISLLIFLLQACTTSHLTREQRPYLPRIPAVELQCLSDTTYQKLYDRQRLVNEYTTKLEVTIDSTQ